MVPFPHIDQTNAFRKQGMIAIVLHCYAPPSAVHWNTDIEYGSSIIEYGSSIIQDNSHFIHNFIYSILTAITKCSGSEFH